jgi:hypothetical protein
MQRQPLLPREGTKGQAYILWWGQLVRILQSIVGFPPKWRRMLSMATRPASIFGIKVPMTHRYCYEALDRTLQDVMGCTNIQLIELPFAFLNRLKAADYLWLGSG